MNKYIIYVRPDGQIDKCIEAYEGSTPETSISLWKLFKTCYKDKSFLYWFSGVVKYAMRHAPCYKGAGASDVVMAQMNNNIDKIFKDKKY